MTAWHMEPQQGMALRGEGPVFTDEVRGNRLS